MQDVVDLNGACHREKEIDGAAFFVSAVQEWHIASLEPYLQPYVHSRLFRESMSKKHV